MIGGGRDRLLEPRLRRRRGRFPRFTPALLVLLGVGGLVALWVWAFSPIFIEPQEFHARQRRFDRAVREVLQPSVHHGGGSVPDLPTWPPALGDDRVRVLACAEAQVARGVRFTSSYHPLSYPWGDVPDHLGTSADVVVRCLRAAGLDLQQLVHIDRVAHPKHFPLHLWSSRRPDKSIDHRRLPNLYAFAKQYLTPAKAEVDNAEQAADFIPGDLVFWGVGGTQGYPGLVGLVIDRRGPDGIPWVVTVFPGEKKATLHHRVNDWPVQAHFRVDVDGILERFLESNPGAVLTPH